MTMDVIKTLLSDLRGAGIKLFLDGDQLKFRASGPMPPALRARVVAKKPELIAYLKELASPAAAEPATISRMAADASPMLSFSQQRLWFLEQLQEEPSGAFNLFAALRLIGQLSREALQAAVAMESLVRMDPRVIPVGRHKDQP